MMHPRFNRLLLVLAISVLTAGCGAMQVVQPSQPETRAQQIPVFQVEPGLALDTLSPHQQTALLALELARAGMVPMSAGVVWHPEAEIALASPPSGFILQQETVAGTDGAVQGIQEVRVLREYRDAAGRSLLVLDRVGFVPRTGAGDEPQASGAALVATSRQVTSTGNQGLASALQEAVKEFQQTAGLTVDGVLGPNTAKAMTRALARIEIAGMFSTSVYSEQPRMELSVLPVGVVDSALANDPERFIGPDGLANVRAQALPLKELQAGTSTDDQYVLFVHFLDRVPPVTPIQVCFSEDKGRRHRDREASSDTVYALPDSWPVIAVPFMVGDVDDALYCNVFVNGECQANAQLK